MRKTVGDEPSSDQKLLPVPGNKVAGAWRGRSISGSAQADSPIRKYLFVMSQWAHITRNWKCSYAAPAWRVGMAGKPINGRSWRKVPLLLWKLSLLSVAWWKQRQGQQGHMVDMSLSGLGNLKHTANPSLHAPWFELSIGLSATLVWNSPSRTGLSSSHCGEPALMNSGSHPEHTMSQFDNSSQAKQEWCYMESQSLVDLTSLVL